MHKWINQQKKCLSQRIIYPSIKFELHDYKLWLRIVQTSPKMRLLALGNNLHHKECHKVIDWILCQTWICTLSFDRKFFALNCPRVSVWPHCRQLPTNWGHCRRNRWSHFDNDPNKYCPRNKETDRRSNTMCSLMINYYMFCILDCISSTQGKNSRDLSNIRPSTC